MGKPNLKLAGGEPRSPERVELASTIERHVAALDAVRRVSQASEQADEVVYRASDTLRAAKAALEAAQAGEGAHLAALALGETTGLSVADAEAAVTQASNDLTIARRTCDALAERAQQEAAEVERAQAALDEKLRNVVKSEANVAQLLAEAKATQAALVSKRVVLRHLLNSHLVAEQEAAELRDFLLFQNHLPAAIGQIEYGNYNDHVAADPYKRAVEALRENADAALPN